MTGRRLALTLAVASALLAPAAACAQAPRRESAADIGDKQRDLQQMQQRLDQRANELQEKTQQRQRELMQPIQARVNAVIQGLRAEGNYALIFDADSPGSNIVAADPGLDITAKVIERLKQSK